MIAPSVCTKAGDGALRPARFAIAVLLLTSLLGCQRPSATETASTEAPDGAEATVPPPIRGQAEQVRVSGVVMARSDVRSVPDTPYSSGIVIVVAHQEMARLLSRVGGGSSGSVPTPPPLRVTDELQREFVVTSSLLQSDGYYSVSLNPGDYYFGVGNLGRSHLDPAALPTRVYGWVSAHVAAGKTRTIDIFYDGESRTASVR